MSEPAVACPFCRSTRTQQIALFGSQAIIGLPGRIVTLPTRIYSLFDYPPQYGLASALSLLFILDPHAPGPPADGRKATTVSEAYFR